MESLIKLDLSGNELCKLENYREKVFESLKQLQVLDGKDKDNQSIVSDSDEEEEYGEENEHEQDEQLDIPQYILDKLDPEIKEKYDNGELSQDQLLQFLNNADDLADGDEEGEFDFDDEEGELEHAQGDAGKEGDDSDGEAGEGGCGAGGCC